MMGQFKRQANKAASNGMKQASKWIGVGKLNVELSAANLELQDLFEQVGEFIYTNRVKDISESPEIQRLFHKVNLQQSKIKSIQEAIDVAKAINKCENCNQPIAFHTKYCPFCSHPQSKEVDFYI